MSSFDNLANITKRKKMNISVTEPDGLNITSMNKDDSVICHSSWVGSWSVYISDIAVVAVNFFFSIFATLINLAVIVSVKRSPVLHRPFNALICSLDAADFFFWPYCTTGIRNMALITAHNQRPLWFRASFSSG